MENTTESTAQDTSVATGQVQPEVNQTPANFDDKGLAEAMREQVQNPKSAEPAPVQPAAEAPKTSETVAS